MCLIRSDRSMDSMSIAPMAEGPIMPSLMRKNDAAAGITSKDAYLSIVPVRSTIPANQDMMKDPK